MLAVFVRTALVASLAAGLLGCGGGGGNDVAPPPPPILRSISLSPVGAAVTTDGTLPFTLTGSYSDGSSRVLTSNVSWTSSNTNAATINNAGLAEGVANGVTVITASVGNLTDQTALNVTTMAITNNALQGNYVFTYTGLDANGPQYMVGIFVADGQGNITGGQVDSNTSTGTVSTAIPSGSYTVHPDGRGSLTLQAALPLGIYTFRFVLSQDGERGYLSSSGINLALGTLEKQSSPPPSRDSDFVGNYVFCLGGISHLDDINVAVVGRFTSDGQGHITSGKAHINEGGNLDNGSSPPTPTTFTGTYAVPNVGVRGTATLDAGESDKFEFAFYLVSSNKAYFIETDSDTSGQALFGAVEKQTNMSFTNASATGGYVYMGEKGGFLGSLVISEQMVLNGAGDVEGGVAVEIAAGVSRAEVAVPPGAYSVASDGSISLTWTLNPGGERTLLGYMVSPTKMFLLQAAPADWSSCGTAERQIAGPFNLATLQGTYAIQMSSVTALANMQSTSGETVVGQLISEGAGNLYGIGDLNAGLLGYGSAEMTATYEFPNDHASFGQGMALVEGADYYFYVVSGSRLIIFSDSYPGESGVAELQ